MAKKNSSLLAIFSLAALLISANSASLRQCEFPAIFNFGDSNSDTGGLSATFYPAVPPYGETTFGMPAGRYSDGRLIIDFIAKSLSLPYLSAYLNSIGSNFSHGANFATGGSTIRQQNNSIFHGGFSPFSLDVQFLQFSEFKSRSQIIYKQGGIFKDLMPSGDYFSRALYTIDIGQNDLTQAYFSNMSTEEVKANVPDMLSKFTSVIEGIYGHGGRFFWIHNTGPLGCLPFILNRVPLAASHFDRVGCGIPIDEAARDFNKQLKETVTRLRKDLPLAVFTYVDIYSVKYSLITQARKYGFEHPLVVCCGGGGGKYNYNPNYMCGAKGVNVNGTHEVLLGKSCKNPLRRINWDGVHYTEAANKWVFDHIEEGAFSDPPLPLSMACHRRAVI